MRRAIQVGWDNIYLRCADIGDQIQDSGRIIHEIVGMARGGLIPAQILAYRLNISKLYSMGLSYYIGVEKQKHPIIYQPLAEDFAGKTVLIVDDVADSGGTFTFVKKELVNRGCKNIITASLYYKPCSKFKPDFVGGPETDPDTWINFPWDPVE